MTYIHVTMATPQAKLFLWAWCYQSW